MKRVIACTLLLMCATDVVQASVCNQKTYDNLYSHIVKQAIVTPELDQQRVFNERNVSIKTLRELCRGQLSSYEKGVRYVGK